MKLNLMIPFQKLETTETGEEEGLVLSPSDPPCGASIFWEFGSRRMLGF